MRHVFLGTCKCTLVPPAAESLQKLPNPRLPSIASAFCPLKLFGDTSLLMYKDFCWRDGQMLIIPCKIELT